MNYRSPAARDEGLGERTIASIASYRESAELDAGEKAAVRFAELLALDHNAIGEDVFSELRRHFTEEQIMEVGWAAGSFIAFGRLIHVFGAKWEGEPGGG
ncbi:MAG: carboxymuconolactone decarboxylase family protein [Candidatus Binatia bacterium]